MSPGLYSNEFYVDRGELESLYICSIILNGSHALLYGDEYDYNEVDTGMQDENKLQKAVGDMSSGGMKHLEEGS